MHCRRAGSGGGRGGGVGRVEGVGGEGEVGGGWGGSGDCRRCLPHTVQAPPAGPSQRCLATTHGCIDAAVL